MSDFKPSTWAQPVQDIVKEYEAHDASETSIEVQDKPEAISESMIRRGLLDPCTGALINNSKSNKITRDNARGFSPRGKMNYEETFGHG